MTKAKKVLTTAGGGLTVAVVVFLFQTFVQKHDFERYCVKVEAEAKEQAAVHWRKIADLELEVDRMKRKP